MRAVEKVINSIFLSWASFETLAYLEATKRLVAGPSGVGRALTAVSMPIEGRDEWLAAVRRLGMRGGDLRRLLSRMPSPRQLDVLAAFVASGGPVPGAAARVGIRPSTAKRHLTDLRARSGLTTEQLIYLGRAEGWLVVPSLEI
jgi:hypothetical protein